MPETLARAVLDLLYFTLIKIDPLKLPIKYPELGPTYFTYYSLLLAAGLKQLAAYLRSKVKYVIPGFDEPYTTTKLSSRT